MAEYIDRESGLAMLHKDEFGTPDERWHPESEIAEAILRLPAADVAPVVHGQWNVGGMFDDFCVCNVCGFKHPMMSAEEFNYCPNCGAKMEETDV